MPNTLLDNHLIPESKGIKAKIRKPYFVYVEGTITVLCCVFALAGSYILIRASFVSHIPLPIWQFILGIIFLVSVSISPIYFLSKWRSFSLQYDQTGNRAAIYNLAVFIKRSAISSSIRVSLFLLVVIQIIILEVYLSLSEGVFIFLIHVLLSLLFYLYEKQIKTIMADTFNINL